MKKILVISWFYPPVNSSEGIVTYKLLNNSKYEYDVFTQKNSTSWSYGNKDYLKNNKNVNCIFSESNTLKQWKIEAVEYFKKNMDKYDVVMTRSMPPESHEVGIMLKKIKPSIKWIASFGDPISNNPYTLLTMKSNPYKVDKTSSIKRIINPFRIIKSIIYRLKKTIKNSFLDTKIESKTLKKCDMVIFNSNEQREYMTKGNLKTDSVIINHSYMEELYPKKVEKNTEKIIISYIGHLDAIRTPKILLEAIKEIKEEDEHLCNKLEVDFYGNLYHDDKIYIYDNELYDIVKYKKQISYLESLKKMKESDYLLHIDANLGDVIDHNIFFAAKLADYIGSKTPIISITMLEGTSANIMRKVNGLILTYSVSDVKNYLRKIIYENYQFNLDEKSSNSYNAKIVATEFDNMVKGLLK